MRGDGRLKLRVLEGRSWILRVTGPTPISRLWSLVVSVGIGFVLIFTPTPQGEGAALETWNGCPECLTDRLLEPLAEGTPFEGKAPLPHFFPDEISQRVKEAIIDAYLGDVRALRDHYRFFQAKDQELRKAKRPVTGLADDLFDLLANTIEDRDRYLKAQRKALALAEDPHQERLIRWRIQEDELNRADSLTKDTTINKAGRLLNHLLRALDLTGLLLGSLYGSALYGPAIDSALYTALNLDVLNSYDGREQRALSLYEAFLKRHPHSPRVPEVQKKIQKFEEKKRKALLAEALKLGEEAEARGDFPEAAFHFQQALILDPESEKAAEGLKRCRDHEQKEKAAIAKALSASPEQIPSQEREGYEALLLAVTTRDPDRMLTEANRFLAQHPQSPLVDAARDVKALAYEIKGARHEAKKALQEIVTSGRSPTAQGRARLLLESPDYDPLRGLEEAQRQYRKEVIRYILLGKDFVRQHLPYAVTPLILQGVSAVTPLGIFLLLGRALNLYQVLVENPIPRTRIIEEAEKYLRDHGPSESHFGEVCEILATAYEKEGAYEKALYYFQLSGRAEEKKIAALKEKAATALLHLADETRERSRKAEYLGTVLARYPDTEAAKEASRKLLEGARNEGLRFSKKFLMENPRLYGWEGLRLKASLFDGNVKNGEIADQGVILRWPTLLIYFKTEDGVQWRFYAIEDETYQRTALLLREILRERALAQFQNGNGGSSPRSKLPWILLEPALRPNPLPPTGEVASFEFLGQGEDGKDGKRWMPKIEGSFSTRGLNGEATLPPTPWGTLFSIGTYNANPYGALQFPLLGSFLPIDLRLEGRPTHIGLFPSIRTVNHQSVDDDLTE